jgi:hypothetical protein
MKIQYGFEIEKYRTEENVEAQLGKTWKKKIFEIVFTNTISQLHPQGLKGYQARACNRVLDALDSTTTDFIDISTPDAEFLKGILLNENASVMPGQARVFCLLQDAIEHAFSNRVEEIKID